MNKEHFLPFIAIAIALVGTAFAIASIAVFLTRGKSKFCINKKMKIGACLITLTTLMSCGNGGNVNINGTDQVTCYDVANTDQISVVDDTINISKTDTIDCFLYAPSYEKYIYKIVDNNDSIIFQNEFSPENYNSEIKLHIDKNIKTGEYELQLCDTTGQNTFSSQTITIIK
ncbi:MAG: hypothetical protein MJ211_05520 [Bacteroidales bacterium]|nr:hypothetical protein [Bacteroidales bacterium]